MAVKPRSLQLITSGGQVLCVHAHAAAAPPGASMIIAAAMAVSQTAYFEFAAFMAEQGIAVWTFDYSGTGQSLQGSMRASRSNISDWLLQDLEAVVQHAAATHPQLPLFILGHSLGGQIVPLLPSVDKVSGLVNIAVGSGARRHVSPDVASKIPVMWYLLVPVLSSAFGYFPGRRIGVIGDVPKRAMSQWRHWCLNPDYILGALPQARAAYQSARYPVLGLAFNDDELLSEAGSRFLHDAYALNEVDYRVIDSAQYSKKRIGHLGFFKANRAAGLWPQVSEWIFKRRAG